MHPDIAIAHDATARLTRQALALLDIPFDPASPISGERFDQVLESLSTQLSDAAACEMAGRPAPPFLAPTVEALRAITSRRAQSSLRAQVESGHLPGSSTSLREAQIGLARAADELGRLCDSGSLIHSARLVRGVEGALRRLHQSVVAYEQSYRRLAVLIARSPGLGDDIADSAARSERALLRCLDRSGDRRTLR